ncbi:MAG: hypothetical protein M1818_005382 [Claussenomyces sp. TS43310]|nr:MAG: hypothetical protein M1818_005382 [Claussenomyces sp. TS43310]
MAIVWRARAWPFGYRSPHIQGAVKRVGLLILVIALALLVSWRYRIIAGDIKDKVARPQRHGGNAGFAPPPDEGPADCSINVTSLRALQVRLELGEQLEYAERRIEYAVKNMARRPLMKLDQDLLLGDFHTINMSDAPMPARCNPPLKVTIPKSPTPDTVNASEILFGISTTMSRLKDLVTIREWSYWLTDGRGRSNGAGLVLLLVDATTTEAEELQVLLNEVGISAEVHLAGKKTEMAERYLSLIPKLHDSRLNVHRRWLALCDDDTFFPSMHGLLANLRQHNHSTPHYIGALSEDIHSVERHGSQAFGGAGVFLSLPLASIISRIYSDCSSSSAIAAADSGWGAQGDILLRRCIYENTEVRLTTMLGLYQLDITGDASGFYESGNKPLSLHHYKGGQWHVATPNEMAKLSRALGEDAFLMRYQTTDDFILSVGYSVAQYPYGIDFDVLQYERTFGAVGDDKGFNFDYVFGPQRKSLSGTGRKIGWQLMQTEVKRNGVVRQVYVRKKDDARWRREGEESEGEGSDGIIVLIWMPG